MTSTPSTSSTTVDNVVFTSGYNVNEIIDLTQVILCMLKIDHLLQELTDQTENVKLIIEF